MSKTTKEHMLKIAGHLRYAASMHAAQAGYWTALYAEKQNDTTMLRLAAESNARAAEAADLADRIVEECGR